MALTYIDESTVDIASDTSATCDKPTGTVEDDIMFALVQNMEANLTTGPSGWTRIANNSRGADYTVQEELWYKVAGGSEPSDYTWSQTGISSRFAIVIATYRGGFDINDPIDVVSNTRYLASNTTWRAASMSVAAANSPLLFFASMYTTTSITWTKPSVPTTEWVEDVEHWNPNSDMGRGIFSMVWSSSGATGDMDATGSVSSQYDKMSFAVALNPEAAGTTLSPIAMRYYRNMRQ